MENAVKIIELRYLNGEIIPSTVSLLPHKQQKCPEKGIFCKKGHKRDTKVDDAVRRMRPPSNPEIDRTDSNKYFISWNQDVPYPLWPKYAPRKRIRIKLYEINNRLKGEAREEHAKEQLILWTYNVTKCNYNPFEEELAELERNNIQKLQLASEIKQLETQIEAIQTQEAELSEEDKRKLVSIPVAFGKFMESRRARKLEPETISAYQGCIDWITEGLTTAGYIDFKTSELRHIHLSEALSLVAEDREWVATTINKGVEFMMSVFNWLETEEYIIKNPSKNKFIKLPTYKTKNRWYDRDLKEKVIAKIIEADKPALLRACQFTYWLMIRSKKELRKLKVGDIDRTLKRVRFTAELSKTKEEVYRDYSDEFAAILDEMQLHQYPANYYVFGEKDGTPSLTQCGHNYFSKMFMAIKEKMELSIDYTIYGFKHTRIVHELMKKTDGYEISYMARHNDRKSTKEYMRDYDITLNNIYGPEDLTFGTAYDIYLAKEVAV
jgi:hypothetical protein